MGTDSMSALNRQAYQQKAALRVGGPCRLASAAKEYITHPLKMTLTHSLLNAHARTHTHTHARAHTRETSSLITNLQGKTDCSKETYYSKRKERAFISLSF